MPEHWIVISGGAKRVGLALAEHFAAKGEKVLISYRTFYPAVADLRRRGVIALEADFSTDQGIIDFAAQVQAHCPRLKALIHNASEWAAEKNLENPTALSALFDRMMQIHGKVPYLLNTLLQPLLQGQHSPGDIIHISDYVTQKGSDKHMAYAAGKAAMENLNLSFAKKFAPQIKVNAIAPALIAFNEGDSEEYRQQALNKSLMASCGGYGEIIAAVEYLLQSRYVTGSCLAVDGGRHLK